MERWAACARERFSLGPPVLGKARAPFDLRTQPGYWQLVGVVQNQSTVPIACGRARTKARAHWRLRRNRLTHVTDTKLVHSIPLDFTNGGTRYLDGSVARRLLLDSHDLVTTRA
jgi:hypothetical protein